MTPLALVFAAFWTLDLDREDRHQVVIPIHAMIQQQRSDAIHDIRIAIQADLERHASRLLTLEDGGTRPINATWETALTSVDH